MDARTLNCPKFPELLAPLGDYNTLYNYREPYRKHLKTAE